MQAVCRHVRSLLHCSLLCVLAVSSAAGLAAEQRFSAERVYAFGDVHGAYQAMLEVLRALDVVDENLDWQAGDSHLVSLGDLLDRGADSRQAMDLLIKLQQQARAAGGRVHVLLGNHELMNLTGDLRYVSAGEYAAFPSDAAADGDRPPGFAAHRAAFEPDGRYGRWLLDQPVAIVINDTAFVHGGLPPMAARLTPEQLQRDLRGKLRELLALRTRLEQAGLVERHRDVLDSADRLQRRLEAAAATADPAAPSVPGEWLESVARFIELARDPQFAHEGVLWYRGTARCHALLEQPVLETALDHWGVARVVVGHSPTANHRVQQRFAGRAVLADTGMLHEYYGGQASGLIFEGDGIEVLYPATGERSAGPDPANWLDFGGLDAVTVQDLLQSGELAPDPAGPLSDEVDRVVVSSGGRSIHAWFAAADRGERRSAQAALALDRLLGFELVAPLAVREYGGEKGVLHAVWPEAYTEAERQRNGWPGPQNWCGEGSLFELMYLLDALIQNRGRHLGSMVYEHRGYGFLSIGHGLAFGKSSALPEYLDEAPRRLPASVAERLAALDLESLEGVAGAWLSRVQLRGILVRRDAILEHWNRGG